MVFYKFVETHKGCPRDTETFIVDVSKTLETFTRGHPQVHTYSRGVFLKSVDIQQRYLMTPERITRGTHDFKKNHK